MNRLRKWVDPGDDEEELDKKMLAVAVRAEYPAVFSVAMKVLSEYAEAKAAGKDNSLKSWEAIQKCKLEQPFWRFMEKNFGYSRETPGLQDLALRMLVTDLVHHLPDNPPQSIAHFVLPQGTTTLNITVFLSQWRNHVSFFTSRR